MLLWVIQWYMDPKLIKDESNLLKPYSFNSVVPSDHRCRLPCCSSHFVFLKTNNTDDSLLPQKSSPEA